MQPGMHKPGGLYISVKPHWENSNLSDNVKVWYYLAAGSGPLVLERNKVMVLVEDDDQTPTFMMDGTLIELEDCWSRNLVVPVQQ